MSHKLRIIPWNDIVFYHPNNNNKVKSDQIILGRGLYNIVLKGKWRKPTGTTVSVAIKIVTESLVYDNSFEQERQMLISEAVLLAEAKSNFVANITEVYGIIDGFVNAETISGLPFGVKEGEKIAGVVMEYLDGKTLKDVLHNSPSQAKIPLQLTDKIHILLEIIKAISDLHAIGIIHGEIKPENIVLSDNVPPVVKITDFGLSIIREESKTHSPYPKTTDHLIYMAPELLKESEYFSKATDMYSFGVLVWEVLVRFPPDQCVSSNSNRFPLTTPNSLSRTPTLPSPSNSTHPQVLMDSLLLGHRPDLKYLPSDTPPILIEMIQDCWHIDPFKRKSGMECLSILQYLQQQYQSNSFDIFFSHAWKDKPFLSYIHRLLIHRGFRIWYDQFEMGYNLSQSMQIGIEHSSIILICLNKYYLSRPNCLYELKEAIRQQKKIVTLIIEKNVDDWITTEFKEMLDFDHKKYVDLSNISCLSEWKDEINGPSEKTLLELSNELDALLIILKELGCFPHLSQVLSFNSLKKAKKAIRLSLSQSDKIKDCDDNSENTSEIIEEVADDDEESEDEEKEMELDVENNNDDDDIDDLGSRNSHYYYFQKDNSYYYHNKLAAKNHSLHSLLSSFSTTQKMSKADSLPSPASAALSSNQSNPQFDSSPQLGSAPIISHQDKNNHPGCEVSSSTRPIPPPKPPRRSKSTSSSMPPIPPNNDQQHQLQSSQHHQQSFNPSEQSDFSEQFVAHSSPQDSLPSPPTSLPEETTINVNHSHLHSSVQALTVNLVSMVKNVQHLFSSGKK